MYHFGYSLHDCSYPHHDTQTQFTIHLYGIASLDHRAKEKDRHIHHCRSVRVSYRVKLLQSLNTSLTLPLYMYATREYISTIARASALLKKAETIITQSHI